MARKSLVDGLRNKFKSSSKNKNRKRRERNRRRPQLETLERRELFAGLADAVVPAALDADAYFQNFDSGLPAAEQGWEYHSTNKGHIQSVNGGMQMDAARYGYSLNEAILHLDLEGRSGVELTLAHDSIFDENAAMPDSFTGHHNSDGIAISNDGETWHRLTSLQGDFADKTFDLDTVIEHTGIEYTSDFQIKFQQYDNFYATYDGRAFDDIRIDVDSLTAPVESTTETIYQQTFRAEQADNWTFSSTATGRIRTDNGRLEMDSSRNRSFALNEAVLHLDLQGRSEVTLRFDHDNTRDENRAMPSSFTGSHNSDGVAISSDGVTWHRLTSLTSDFNSREFDLDKAIAAAGIEYTSDFQIKFQQYDNYTMPIDGRAIDNVIVTATAITNTAPVGVGDAYAVDEDSVLSINAAQGVLANDTDAEGDHLTVSIADQAEHGTVTLNADGSFEYVPETNFHGQDTFTYSVSDGSQASSAVTNVITVNAINDAPMIQAIEKQEVAQGTVEHVVTLIVSDVDSDLLTVAATVTTPDVPVSVRVDGERLIYSIAPSFVGYFETVVRVNDGTEEVTKTISTTSLFKVDANGVLTINGTEGNDVIVIDEVGGVITVQSALNSLDEPSRNETSSYSTSEIKSIVFDAKAGNDEFVNGSPISAIAYGGAGNDILTGGNGSDELYGGAANDQLNGNGGDDKLVGDSGADTMIGGLGNDLLNGGEGDDVLFGETRDLNTVNEHDIFLGGPGEDTFAGRTSRPVSDFQTQSLLPEDSPYRHVKFVPHSDSEDRGNYKDVIDDALLLWSSIIVAQYEGETIEVKFRWEDKCEKEADGECQVDTSGNPIPDRDNRASANAEDWELLSDNESGVQVYRKYPIALANHLVEEDLGDEPDIRVTVNSNTLNRAQPVEDGAFNTFVHEIGHGLGFSSSYSEDGEIDRLVIPNSHVTLSEKVFDRFLVDSNGTQLSDLNERDRQNALTSDDLRWSGTNGIAANAGNKPMLDAPSPFNSGSSISHLDPSSHDHNNMSRGYHETRMSSPGALELGMLRDLGYQIDRSARPVNDPHFNSLASVFQNAHDSAVSNGFASGYPIFAQDGTSVGEVGWNLTEVNVRQRNADAYGGGNSNNVGERFREAHTESADLPAFAAGFPNMHEAVAPEGIRRFGVVRFSREKVKVAMIPVSELGSTPNALGLLYNAQEYAKGDEYETGIPTFRSGIINGELHYEVILVHDRTALNTVQDEMVRMLGPIDFRATVDGKPAHFGHWANRYVAYLQHEGNSFSDLQTAIMHDHAHLAIPRMMESVLGGPIDYEANNARLGHRRNVLINRARSGDSYSHILDAIEDVRNTIDAENAAAITRDTGYEHRFFRGSDGNIQELYRKVGTQDWKRVNLGADRGFPKASGRAAVYEWKHNKALFVFYRGTDGHLHQLSITRNGSWSHTNLSGKRSFVRPEGDPSVSGDSTSLSVRYKGTNGQSMQLLFRVNDQWRQIVDSRHSLVLNERLEKGKSIYSPDGKIRLTMQNNGNLELVHHSSGFLLWQSNTAGQGWDRAEMRSDGFFVLVDGNRDKELWRTPGGNQQVSFVTVQNDGNLVLYRDSGRAVTSTRTEWGHTLPANANDVQSISRDNGYEYRFYRGTDGHINELNRRKGTSAWHHVSLGMDRRFPKASGRPAVHEWNHNNALYIFYRGTDGKIQQLYFLPNGSWKHSNLSTRGFVRSKGDPTVNSNSNSLSATYAGVNNKTIELRLVVNRGWKQIVK